MESELFCDAFGNRILIDQVAQEIADFILSAPHWKYKIVIGTDSENHSTADFVTAIVARRMGNGGRYWWARVHRPAYATLRDRIYQEALFSLAVSEKFINILKLPGNLPVYPTHNSTADQVMCGVDFEIHVDVGEKGETRLMMSEVVGMIRGSGFEVKTKPESYGASKIADRHV